MSLLIAAAVAQAVTPSPRFNHVDDVAVVAAFLSDVHADKVDGSGIEVKNWENPALANFSAFVTYANACQIERIYAVPSATIRLPIGVEWDCGRFITIGGKPVWEERSAGFWVKDGRVVKLTFGKGPTIVIQPPKANTDD